MPRIFSGIQPSGELHIGNWLGAVQNWVNLQRSYDTLFCVVDLHAITGKYDHESLAQRTRDMAIGLLAAGIDPERAILFVQSHVPQHSELQWLLNTVTPLGELERMTQFKDKAQRFESVPAGLLNYPILMAADILLYRADLVPVGEDQVQHLELTREIARKWNAEFGRGEAFFPEPQPILTEAKRITGLDGQAKMSKSLGNTIGLLDSPEEIWQKLRPAKTDPARVTRHDPGTPEICNIYHLHQYFSAPDTVAMVAENCRGARWGCLDCKRVLADNMIAALSPIRERALELQEEPERVDQILADGASTARRIASETMREVRDRMGLLSSTPPALSAQSQRHLES
jgi:tryptophanyl-tRNA synthetase